VSYEVLAVVSHTVHRSTWSPSSSPVFIPKRSMLALIFETGKPMLLLKGGANAFIERRMIKIGGLARCHSWNGSRGVGARHILTRRECAETALSSS
jgi:hypothetical protein